MGSRGELCAGRDAQEKNPSGGGAGDKRKDEEGDGADGASGVRSGPT